MSCLDLYREVATVIIPSLVGEILSGMSFADRAALRRLAVEDPEALALPDAHSPDAHSPEENP